MQEIWFLVKEIFHFKHLLKENKENKKNYNHLVNLLKTKIYSKYEYSKYKCLSSPNFEFCLIKSMILLDVLKIPEGLLV